MPHPVAMTFEEPFSCFHLPNAALEAGKGHVTDPPRSPLFNLNPFSR